ncbi:TetR/AcrR family transcriptional regulator [Aurantiacibacter suaedae]|uniref:TetR/AcrR family transcriptional regulator n=1 Tax=Aurantiacibacter suaedae TaxID=2545755 RepID=UPI0010F4570F|nr:TetR/AcrR family transcriptional regulator [Aurantiacibacter suaedae]
MTMDERQLDLVDKVARTFRENGFHGTTMSIISDRTDLGRSSIYHHFGRGKLEMAHRSLESIEAIIHSIRQTTSSPTLSPATKWEVVRAMLHRHYEGGLLGCLLAVFAMEEVPNELRDQTGRLFSAWADATAELYRMAGCLEMDALRYAQRDVILIQGALVLSRAHGSSAPFEEALEDISEALELRTSQT